MVDVYFRYIDGNEILCKAINRIEVPSNSGGYAQISSDQLLSQNIIFYDMIHLHSDVSNYSVSCRGILYFEIRKS